MRGRRKKLYADRNWVYSDARVLLLLLLLLLACLAAGCGLREKTAVRWGIGKSGRAGRPVCREKIVNADRDEEYNLRFRV